MQQARDALVESVSITLMLLIFSVASKEGIKSISHVYENFC